MTGKLYLVATPIGNMEDITFRAIKILNEVDYIAAEDTRHTIKLLNHYEIKKPLKSYHEHNKTEKAEKIIQDLQKGQRIALVTDAGTPAISDPGGDLVKLCYDNNIEVTSIPGPAALINGLILSGENTKRFCFEGFLPQVNKERRKILTQLENETRTIILYEAPHKLRSTLEDLITFLGNRSIALTRELTKKFEEIKRMSLSDAISYYKDNEPRGEYVLIIKGKSEEEIKLKQRDAWLEMSLDEHMNYYLEQGYSKIKAIKFIAKDREVNRQEIYKYFNQ